MIAAGQSMEIKVEKQSKLRLTVSLFKALNNGTIEHSEVSRNVPVDRWIHVGAIWNPSPILMLLVDGKLVSQTTTWSTLPGGRPVNYALSFGCAFDLSTQNAVDNTCTSFQIMNTMMWEKTKTKTLICKIYSNMD